MKAASTCPVPFGFEPGRLLKSGIEAKFEFEGDLFEMEDQRNWTDGSFKTYCTPLSLGYPFQALAGQSFKQKVTLRGRGGRFTNTQGVQMFNSSSALRCVERFLKLGSALPHMAGVSPRRTRICSRGCASIICALTCILGKVAQSTSLARAVGECSLLNCGLELALFLTNNADQELHESSLAVAAPGSRLPSPCLP